MMEAMAFSCLELPPVKEIRQVPSASLLETYKTAKQHALSAEKTTTVIVTELVDLCSLEMIEISRMKNYTSFTTSFGIGVGREGVIIWQTGNDGFDQYLQGGSDRVQKWAEADEFITDFDKLVKRKVISVVSSHSYVDNNVADIL